MLLLLGLVALLVLGSLLGWGYYLDWQEDLETRFYVADCYLLHRPGDREARRERDYCRFWLASYRVARLTRDIGGAP